MSNENEEILGNEEVDSDNPLLTMDIGELRKYCSLFKIQAARTWKREDFIRAISEKLAAVEHASVVKANDPNAPRPGYTRLVIHKDPSPSATNRGVPLAVNGHIYIAPRGVEIELPTPFVEVLKNSTTHTTVNTNPNAANIRDERFEHVVATAYPFNVIAATPGDYLNPNDQRVKTYRLREAFLTKYGKWPTAAELKEAITHGRIDGLI